MIIDSLQPESLRYERKFAITQLSRHELESILRLHPACFSEIYHERYVNSIYFDTVSRAAYSDNLAGVSNRLKVRLRWYGELFGSIEEPVLELKIKRNLLGGKIRYTVPPFRLDNGYSLEQQRELFDRSEIPDFMKTYLKSLRFSLLDRYRRKYYRSHDGNFRITIDYDMEFYRVDSRSNSFVQKHSDGGLIVLELKYADGLDEEAREITRHFPVRMTKNSKYVNGIEKVAWA